MACELTQRVFFLKKCPPGRLAGQLSRYKTAPRPWTGEQVIRAMDRLNVRLGYTAPVVSKTRPWGLLAWYLTQIDPVADHPAYDGAFGPPVSAETAGPQPAPSAGRPGQPPPGGAASPT